MFLKDTPTSFVVPIGRWNETVHTFRKKRLLDKVICPKDIASKDRVYLTVDDHNKMDEFFKKDTNYAFSLKRRPIQEFVLVSEIDESTNRAQAATTILVEDSRANNEYILVTVLSNPNEKYEVALDVTFAISKFAKEANADTLKIAETNEEFMMSLMKKAMKVANNDIFLAKNYLQMAVNKVGLTIVNELSKLFYYIKNNQVEKEIDSQPSQSEAVSKSSSQNYTPRKTTTSLTKRYVIRHSYVERSSDEPARSYNIHTNNFTRRGHYRTLKDGRRIWVKASVVRDTTKENKPHTPKEYKL